MTSNLSGQADLLSKASSTMFSVGHLGRARSPGSWPTHRPASPRWDSPARQPEVAEQITA